MAKKKKSTKTNSTPSRFGSFELDNGVVVVRPPVESEDVATAPATSDKTTVASQKGTVVVEVANATTQTWDKQTEISAHEETVATRKENASRAKEAHIPLTAKKLKTGSIVSSGTILDIDISEYDSADEARSRAATTTENEN